MTSTFAILELSGILQIASKGFLSYFTNGFAFFLLHCLVLYALVKSNSLIKRETVALRTWEPALDDLGVAESTSAESRETSSLVQATSSTSVLDAYEYESVRLGSQGIFVPLTDYSDRLDSIVEGLLSELHDRTNLFLLVGIAGTLFGLFEFAVSATNADLKIAELGGALAKSMGKAFPVGFVGLVLTLIFQMWSARPERRLREALTQATNRALKARARISRSEAQIVAEAANRIESSMRPLADLKDTLAETIKPMVDSFEKSSLEILSEARKLAESSSKSSQKLDSAIDGLTSGVSTLTISVSRQEGLLERIPAIFDRTSELQKSQLESLTRYEEGMDDLFQNAKIANTELQSAAASLAAVPASLSETFRASLDSVSAPMLGKWHERIEEIVDSLKKTSENEVEKWGGAVDSLVKDLQTSHATHLEVVKSDTKKLTDALEGAASNWGRVAESAETIIKEPITQLIVKVREGIAADLKSVANVLENHLPKLPQQISDSFKAVEDNLTKVEKLTESLDRWMNKADSASERAALTVDHLGRALDTLGLNSGAGSTPDLIQTLKDASSQMKGLTELLRGELKDSSGTALVHNLLSSRELLEQIVERITKFSKARGIIFLRPSKA